MTRSIGRTHRLVSLVATAVALAAVGLASGCSAGQLAETSRIVPSVPGGFTSIPVPNPQNPDSQIQIQNVTIVDSSTGYPAGASAPLSLRVFNQTDSPITVAPGLAVLQSTRPDAIGAKAGTLAWMTSGSASAAPTPSASTPVPPASAGASASPSATPTAPPAPPITIPPAGFVILDPSQAQYLAVTNLAKQVGAGDVIKITLDFVYQGQAFTGAVPATFAPPSSAPPRVIASPGESTG